MEARGRKAGSPRRSEGEEEEVGHSSMVLFRL